MPAVHPIRFANLNDLARLPWFDVDQGRLVLADKDVAPIIDVHTHIALSYLRAGSIDPVAPPTGDTELYLPACNAIDLDVYANRNFTLKDHHRMNRDLVWGAITSRGMRATHTTGNLQQDMEDVGIRHAVVLPIELEFTSHNAVANLDALERADSDFFIPFGSVHPRRGKTNERLDDQAHRGIAGIKLHPNIQMLKPNGRSTMKVWRACAERQIPVLMHCGPVSIPGETRLAKYLSQVRHFETPLQAYPNLPIIMGHAGALQSDLAIQLQRRYPNAILEVSCLSLSAIEDVITRGDPDRIVFGSDWPFYHPAMPLAKVLIATEHDHVLRRKILFDNAARLFNL